MGEEVEITDFPTAYKYGALIAPAALAFLSSVGMAYYSGQSDQKQRNNLYKTFALYLIAAATLVVYGACIWLGIGVYFDTAAVPLPFWWWGVIAIIVFLYVLNMLRHGGRYGRPVSGSKHPMDGHEYEIPTYAWAGAIGFGVSYVCAMLSQFTSVTAGFGLTFGLIGLAFQGLGFSGFITAYRRYSIAHEEVKQTNEEAAKLYNYKLVSLWVWILTWIALDLGFILGPNVANVAALDNDGMGIWLLVVALWLLFLFAVDYWLYDVKRNPGSALPTFDTSGAQQIMAALASLNATLQANNVSNVKKSAAATTTTASSGSGFNFDIGLQQPKAAKSHNKPAGKNH